jgi:thiamine biosynthesis lipoprotein
MKHAPREQNALEPKRTSSRREFLRGKSAADAVEDLVDGLAQARAAEIVPPTAAQIAKAKSEKLLLHFTRSAMACDFQIFLPYDDSPRTAETAMAALDVVAKLEDQLSVYRPQSEVSRLNECAHLGAIPVERQLFDLLAHAYALSEATDGAFDITAGPLVKAWGFYRREGRIPSEAELAEALSKTGFRHLALDAAHRSLHFVHEGLEINLGAIGKGYALDRCADFLTQNGVPNFVLHGGQSSVLARGQRDTLLGGWNISISHPERTDEVLVDVELKNEAVGTSGTAKQHFFHRGKRYGHLIDPRTGQPVDHLLSATCIAPTAADADALATAFFVLGEGPTRRYCEAHPEIGAILITPDSKVIRLGKGPIASRED